MFSSKVYCCLLKPKSTSQCKANTFDVSSIHFYGHWQTPSDGLKSQNIIVAWPSRALSRPSPRASHLPSSPHLSLPPICRSLIGQLAANRKLAACHVTRAPPTSGQGFPLLCSGLIQFAQIYVRGLIKYSDAISKVAGIRAHSHLKTLHTITFFINISHLQITIVTKIIIHVFLVMWSLSMMTSFCIFTMSNSNLTLLHVFLYCEP